MKPESIFWIASMTKPVTSVAAMILVEQGKLDLDAPVAQYLPELKDMQVATENKNPETGATELTYASQKRPMTVRDLFRHTSGLVYPPQYLDSPIHRLYRKAVFARNKTLADFVASLPRLPLAHQPGEVWEYSWGVDVLARIVEVQSGQSFDEFLKTHIFEPLRMVDTGFYAPEEKLGRLVDPPGEQREGIWDVTTEPKLFSGGGGLVSTAPDYLRFCQMLLNDGELDGARILKPESVQLMTTNSLPSDIRYGMDFIGPAAGSTWGLGFAIRTDPEVSAVPGSVGSYTWSGAGGTVFWVDPAQKMIVIAMVQTYAKTEYRGALRRLVYGALQIPEEPLKPLQGGVAAEKLADYAGSYDFGFSTSAADKQNIARGVGIASVGMAEGGLKVTAVADDSPAAAAGVAPGDLIARIDGAPVKDMTFAEILAKARGPVGSKVTLEIMHPREEGSREVAITRAPQRSHEVELSFSVDHGRLVATAIGAWPILDFEKRRPVELEAQSETEFYVPGGDHTRIVFVRDPNGKVSEAVLNPGPSEQRGRRLD